jgi:hypothetical protein
MVSKNRLVFFRKENAPGYDASYDYLSIDGGSTFSHAAPCHYLLEKCVSPPHHSLPEPLRVLLLPYSGSGGMYHGSRRR